MSITFQHKYLIICLCFLQFIYRVEDKFFFLVSFTHRAVKDHKDGSKLIGLLGTNLLLEISPSLSSARMLQHMLMDL